MRTVVVIPCRWDSSRFPGKSLSVLAGRPLIQWVYERASAVKEADQVIVATDDGRIEEAVLAFGGKVITTSSSARTGSDRVAEVAERIGGDFFLNLQGDELIQDAAILDELIRSFKAAQPLGMGTLKREITEWREVSNPNVVKVVTDENGFALYFSRSPIPYQRVDSLTSPPSPKTFYKHLGIYIFERETLKRFSSLPTGFLEGYEKLEQLRALEHGIRIKVWETSYDSLRVDTREDLRQAERSYAGSG